VHYVEHLDKIAEKEVSGHHDEEADETKGHHEHTHWLNHFPPPKNCGSS